MNAYYRSHNCLRATNDAAKSFGLPAVSSLVGQSTVALIPIVLLGLVLHTPAWSAAGSAPETAPETAFETTSTSARETALETASETAPASEYGTETGYTAGGRQSEEMHRETASSTSFEGSITISRYTIRADGSEYWVSSTPLLIHPEYILMVQSEGESIEILGNIRAEGVLIRQRQEDFVFLTSDRKAVIMNKQELQQMIGMLETMRGRTGAEQPAEPDVKFQQTDERRTIEEYRARKWIVKQDNNDSEWHIWVTDELSVPWGLLSERWLTRQLSLSGLPAEQWFIDEKLPVQAEHWVRGELAEVIKMNEITSESIPLSRFQIPGDYQRITFQQMLFDRMRNR